MSKGIDQLKRHEGFRGDVYKCTAGKNTIGYGRNIDDNPITEKEFKECGIEKTTPLKITEQQASKLLELDIRKHVHAVNTSFPDIVQLLNEPRQWVLYNMSFNIGMTKLRKFQGMFSAVLQGNFVKASIEMLDSKWAKQVKGRANELALQMKTGDWQA